MTLHTPHAPRPDRRLRPRLAAHRAVNSVAVAAVAGLLLVTAGCRDSNSDRAADAAGTSSSATPTATASGSQTPTQSGAPSPSATVAPPSVVPSRQTLPPVPPTSKPKPTPLPPSGATIVVDGVASQGVEAGCTVFTATDQKVYLLMGAGSAAGEAHVPFGVPLRIRGTLLDQVVSYCQQGTPLDVVDVTRR